MNVLAEKQKNLLYNNYSKEEFDQKEQEFLELYFKLRLKEEEKLCSKLSLE